MARCDALYFLENHRRQLPTHGGRWVNRARATLVSSLREHLLGLGDCARRVELFRASLRAVHDRMAAIQPERVLQLVQSLAGGFIAGQIADVVGAPWTTTLAAVVVGVAYTAIHVTHREFRTVA